MLASVRVIKVSNIPYVQVVEYVRRPSGKQGVKVLRSFGRYTTESWLRAHQYSASYNQLRQVTQTTRGTKTDWDEFLRGALATFGAILGLTIVGHIVKELLQDDD